jgi:hypothetical protein
MTSKQIIEKIWDWFGISQISNILSAIMFLSMIIGGIVAKVIDFSSWSPDQKLEILYIVIGIETIVLLLTTIFNICFGYNEIKKHKTEVERYKIIEILCKLQNKYILTPEFKTVEDHGNSSKEKDLKSRGEAIILTNSLKYDIFYCDQIACNIIKEAKYTYVIPKDSQTINDLESYIVALYNKISEQIALRPGINATDLNRQVAEGLGGRIEFWFFDEDVLCLNNFARFKQVGVEQPFLQSWWYVNPIDRNPSSYMLVHEIIGREDEVKLDVVFDALRNMSKPVDGNTIYEKQQHGELDKYLRNL